MVNPSSPDDLLKAADEYAKNKKDKVEKPVKEIHLSDTEDNAEREDSEGFCDDPECSACRLMEYESILQNYLEDIALNEAVFTEEARKSILEDSKLVQIIVSLMIRTELLETQLDFVLGNEERVLFRICNNPLYQKAMSEEEEE